MKIMLTIVVLSVLNLLVARFYANAVINNNPLILLNSSFASKVLLTVIIAITLLTGIWSYNGRDTSTNYASRLAQGLVKRET